MHMGNLVQILTVRRFQLAGHRPLALVGGATGLIGDPKESGERTLNPTELVAEWVARFRAQLERFYDFDSPDNAAVMVNNYDWTQGLSTLEFLRDVGKHFSVNRMLDREAVAARLAGNGISYTEFSYQLLQSVRLPPAPPAVRLLAADRRLRPVGQHRRGRRPRTPCRGKPRARADHAAGHQVGRHQVRQDRVRHGLARRRADLAVRLVPVLAQRRGRDRALAAADLLVPQRTEEIEALEESLRERPQARDAQRALAQELTDLVHGVAERERVEAAAKALFGQGDVADLDLATLEAALAEAPHGEVTAGEWADGLSVADALARSGLVASKGAGRRTITEGGAYVSNVRVAEQDAVLTEADLLHGRWILLRRGRRHIGGIRVNTA